MYYPAVKMWNGSTSSVAYYTTNNNGAGSGTDVIVESFAYYNASSASHTYAHTISFVLKVENTTTAQILVSTNTVLSASATGWEGAGTLKVTKLSSSLI